jgi:hypothetical protein
MRLKGEANNGVITARVRAKCETGARAVTAPLVKAHKSPLGCRIIEASMEAYPEGSLIKIQPTRAKVPGKAGGKRGAITEFTAASQRRMRYSMAKVDRKEVRLFVSLTYPNDFPEDPERVARDLDCLRKRMKRKGFAGHWKRELKKRKSGSNEGKIAPHFHGIIYGTNYAELLCFLVKAWHEIAGGNDENHIIHGIDIKVVSDEEGIRRYTSKVNKYMAKNENDTGEALSVGRFWGVMNRDLVPWAEKKKHSLANDAAYDLLRAARRYAHIKTRSYKSLTILCNSPGRWMEYAEFLHRRGATDGICPASPQAETLVDVLMGLDYRVFPQPKS